jgi:hypothetical protein
VDQHYRFSFVERREEAVLAAFAEVGPARIGQQHHAICVQVVDGASRLSSCLRDMRHGHRREESEATVARGGEIGGVIVQLTGQRSGVGRPGEKGGARCRDRQDRGVYAEFRLQFRS